MRLPMPEEVPSEVVTDAEGFVEMGSSSGVSSDGAETQTSKNASGGDFFNFLDNSSSSTTALSPNTTPSEDLRKISQQLSDLDNKIYKIEQRIELLEKKAGVDSGSSVGAAGW